MTEPITTNRSLIIPNTGDLTGAWGTSALNPNFQTIDALFGGVTTISLSSATTILLTVPATTGVWPGSLSQSVNAMIRFTGAQTGSATIQFTLPGFYIIDNQCTGTSVITLQPSNLTGNVIGAIPGKKQKVFFDGTHMDYVDMPDPGTAYDLHTNTTTLPFWMRVCTIAPYLVKDGSVYSTSTYPALFQNLGSTFGGNGVTTFAVPDEMNRFRLAVDNGSRGRISPSINGMNGTTFGSSGGTATPSLITANLPPYTPAGSVSGFFTRQIKQFSLAGSGTNVIIPSSGDTSDTENITATFTGSGQGGVSSGMNNIPPAIISFLPLIKT